LPELTNKDTKNTLSSAGRKGIFRFRPAGAARQQQKKPAGFQQAFTYISAR
jgi:hypothetical protein